MKSFALLALAFLSFHCTSVRAQSVVDNFEDGDLLNPTWFGDTEDFVVENGRLRLMADGAGESVLNVRLPSVTAAVDSFAVEFLVEMDFAPSASNFCTVALLNESTIGSVSGQVMQLQFGGISGDQDALSVFVADGDVVFGEVEGIPGALGSAPAIVRWRVTYSPATNYQVFADYTGGTDFQLEGTIPDLAPLGFDYFQLTCNYTATRADKFSFDDLNTFLQVEADVTPPSVTAASVTGPSEIQLTFSEDVNEVAAETFANHVFSNGLNVVAATLNDRTLVLQLDGTLPLAEPFTLTVLNLEDVAGNVAADIDLDLIYDPAFLAEPGEMIITEFMADPNPVVGLPEAEYVEIFNAGERNLQLRNVLQIGSGGSPATYRGTETLRPGEYAVLVPESDAGAFAALDVKILPVALPSLTNSGDVITIIVEGLLMQEINYTDAWYNDPERDGGGYSIEYTGEGADAGCSASWKASEDLSGGTPGRANSVTGRIVDVVPPVITGLNVTDGRVDILFNEDLDPEQIVGGDLISIDNGASITATEVIERNTITLFTNLEEGIIYTLTILPDFSDCAGNFPAEALTLQLAIPGTPAVGDVIINEILFNPGSGGSDFVELYNCSEQVFQIGGWVLANTQSTSQTSAERTITATRLFLPGEYLTITADPQDLMTRYLEVDSSLLVDNNLPSLPDDEGNLTVFVGGVAIDAFDYNEDLHSQLIGDEDGVSLERLRQKTTTQDDNNWFSAAQSEGFATPTRPNSQARDVLPTPTEQTFTLVNTTFSPDGDSFEDLLELQYLTDRPGFLARIRIFDAQGRPTRTLRQVELLAGAGTIRWDGVNDEGLRARTGVYVLFVELFNPDGEVREEKLTAVLAGTR